MVASPVSYPPMKSSSLTRAGSVFRKARKARARAIYAHKERALSHEIADASSRTDPRPLIAATDTSHAYMRCLYSRLQRHFRIVRAPTFWLRHAASVPRIDLFHMHWPEHYGDLDPVKTSRLIDRLNSVGATIVVTNHNLMPHSRRTPDALASYELWASAADAIIHHSHWGEQIARERYVYSQGARHATILPGHTAECVRPYQDRRSHIERDLGLPPCSMRFGLFGKPRELGQAQMALDTFALAAPSSAQLVLAARGDGLSLPDDPRLKLLPGNHVPMEDYFRRVSVVDLFIIPEVSSTDRLTSGIAMDSLGAGVGALAGSWQFLVEYLSDSASFYGDGQEGLADRLRDLDENDVAGLATAARRLQSQRSWELAADKTRDLMLAMR